MKFFLFALMICLLWLLAPSCTKDKAAELIPPNNCDSVTYLNNTKAIFDTHCNQPVGTCHDASGAQAAVIMDSYSGTKNAFQTHGALCTITQTSGCLPMPDQMPKLTDSLINVIQCWVNNGYPQ